MKWGDGMKVYDKSAIDGFKLKDNAIPIIEVDRKIDMDDLLKIGGHLYTVCMKSLTEDYVVVKALKVMELPDEAEEFSFTNEITCPYCESEIESFEMEDEDDDYECTYCHSHFSYQREVTVTYNSQPISKAEAIEL